MNIGLQLLEKVEQIKSNAKQRKVKKLTIREEDRIFLTKKLEEQKYRDNSAEQLNDCELIKEVIKYQHCIFSSLNSNDYICYRHGEYGSRIKKKEIEIVLRLCEYLLSKNEDT